MGSIENYDYELPQELIAQRPLPHRADSRLMVVDRNSASIEHLHIRDLPEILMPADALVLNDTQVVPARLVGYRTDTGGRWFGLFLSASEGLWKVMCKTRGKLRANETITLQDRNARDLLRLQLVSPIGDGIWIARPEADAGAFEILEQVGRVPLPPYIRAGEMVDSDVQRYQTVFSRIPGAVAAPTAGLHFTEPLLQQLNGQGVATCKVTLHVGIGTFRPINSDQLDDHEMHAEWGSIDQSTVDILKARRGCGGRILAVGTTSVRVLETASRDGELRPWTGETDLFIRPPYVFHAVDGLLTNFHLPKSTLLVLVRTFGGDQLIRDAYEEAIRERYRFYSYGDAMLIL